MLIENKFTTEEVIKGTGGILVNGDMGIPFKGICTDTRVLEPGYLFWALKGKNFDGHSFWKEALEKGAKGLVLSYFPRDLKLEELPRTISLILVRDTLYALGELAKWYRMQRGFKVIAITGSCGKTSTKELTFALLSNFYRVVKNEANYNNLIGGPLTILGIRKNPDFVILEVGTSLKGEIKRHAEITEPLISLITCIYPAHLEGLESLQGVLEEKISLFEGTAREGTLVYFYDQEPLRERIKAFSQKKISYGESEGADLRLLEAKPKGERYLARISYENKVYEFKVSLPGRHHLLNLLGAIGIGLATGLKIEDLINHLPEDPSFLVRGKIYRKGTLTILDDTYNANPGSMRMALYWLADQPIELGPKIAILGDMKELGEGAETYHSEIGRLAGELVDKAIFIGEMALNYAEGFKNSGKPFEAYTTVEAFLERGELTEEKAVILVKGSRALKMERIIKRLLGEE